MIIVECKIVFFSMVWYDLILYLQYTYYVWVAGVAHRHNLCPILSFNWKYLLILTLNRCWKSLEHSAIPIVQPTRCTCFSNYFIHVKCSTCFGRSFRASLGAQNCTCICQTSAASSSCLTYACCHMCSFELLMMDGKTVRNM